MTIVPGARCTGPTGVPMGAPGIIVQGGGYSFFFFFFFFFFFEKYQKVIAIVAKLSSVKK